MARPKKANKNIIKVDFSGVEGRIALPEGDYRLIVCEVSQDTSENGNAYLKWKFKTIHETEALNDRTLYYNTSLQPQALWNLRNLLDTLGIEVPDGPLDIDLKELVDCEMMGLIENETYNGKKQSKIVDFMPCDEEEDVKVEEGDQEAVEGITQEEIEGSTEEELNEIIEKYDLEVNLKKAKTIKKKRALVLEACEEAGYLVEEEEEGGEAVKLSAYEINAMKTDELENVIDQYDLDIDLSDYNTKRKKQNAVIDSMEESGFLEEEE
jgi:hypothetical protein